MFKSLRFHVKHMCLCWNLIWELWAKEIQYLLKAPYKHTYKLFYFGPINIIGYFLALSTFGAYPSVIRITAPFAKNISGVNCATNFINCITFIELSMNAWLCTFWLFPTFAPTVNTGRVVAFASKQSCKQLSVCGLWHVLCVGMWQLLESIYVHMCLWSRAVWMQSFGLCNN